MKIKSTEYLQIDPLSEIFRNKKQINLDHFYTDFGNTIYKLYYEKVRDLKDKGWTKINCSIKEDNSACGDPLFMLIFEVERLE